MFKNRRTILIIIIVVALALLAWWLWVKFAPTPGIEVTKPTPPKPTSVSTVSDTLIQEELTKQIAGKSQAQISDQAKIYANARYFVERYGSFSSQANWQNLTDVKSVVTRQLRDELENLMAKNPIDAKDEYYSLTTKILGLRLVSQSDSQATVDAQTQKQEVSGEEARTFYQDIKVYLIKDGEQWLISDFDWGEEKLR